jgi:hypothetical protein
MLMLLLWLQFIVERGSEILENILASNKEGKVRTAKAENYKVMMSQKKKDKLELDNNLFLKAKTPLPSTFQIDRFLRGQGIDVKHKNDLFIYLETCMDATNRSYKRPVFVTMNTYFLTDGNIKFILDSAGFSQEFKEGGDC